MKTNLKFKRYVRNDPKQVREVDLHYSGTKYWTLNGKCHNENSPAIEYPDERKEWWFNDQRHRLDGPAIEWYHGTKRWYLEGTEYKEKHYWEALKEYKEKNSIR